MVAVGVCCVHCGVSVCVCMCDCVCACVTVCFASQSAAM